ncbi:MAG: non-specific endonuclease [Gemmatimonadetes bacterium]|nr:non-specific endonuclease [Gemmatimonadota bacterium]
MGFMLPRRTARVVLAVLALATAAACSEAPTGPRGTAAAPAGPHLTTYPSAIYRNHLEFGTPRDASSSDDLILSRRTQALSYNCAKGIPNWVSWNLNKTHFGDAARSSSFYTDASLPTGCYRVTTSDYTNSGYSRGHMTRSEERTWSVADNKEVFQMTNILPQYQDMNGGPWYKFEQYLQDQAQISNKEMYVISGGYGNRGTLNNAGKVVINTRNYKIVVIMPYGQGLANVTSNSSIQVIAVDMPNVTGIISQPWTAYTTTVDKIEAATGYNFLDKLPDSIETYWESR